MMNLIRMTSLAAVAAAALASTPALAAPVGSSNGDASATARVLRPLTLTHVQDLSFGDIMLSGAGAWTGAVVDLAMNGTLTCGTNLTCSGTRTVAVYNVAGTQGQVVTISAPAVTLTNAGGATLNMNVNSPGTVTLANSGAPGSNFNLGGSISLDSTTADGVYTGTFAVTVDY